MRVEQAIGFLSQARQRHLYRYFFGRLVYVRQAAHQLNLVSHQYDYPPPDLPFFGLPALELQMQFPSACVV